MAYEKGITKQNNSKYIDLVGALAIGSIVSAGILAGLKKNVWEN